MRRWTRRHPPDTYRRSWSRIAPQTHAELPGTPHGALNASTLPRPLRNRARLVGSGPRQADVGRNTSAEDQRRTSAAFAAVESGPNFAQLRGPELVPPPPRIWDTNFGVSQISTRSPGVSRTSRRTDTFGQLCLRAACGKRCEALLWRKLDKLSTKPTPKEGCGGGDKIQNESRRIALRHAGLWTDAPKALRKSSTKIRKDISCAMFTRRSPHLRQVWPLVVN